MYVMTKDSFLAEKIGGKAAALALLSAEFDNIPAWFALSIDAYEAYNSGKQAEIQGEIVQALSNFDDSTLFAVRSSASGEDGVSYSFAGQFETYLNIKKHDVLMHILKVWQSAFSGRVETYKSERGVEEGVSIPAVLVQKMIHADYAGVAFSANPVTGNIKECLVCAVKGLGDKLVDGSVNPENYIIENNFIKSSPREKTLSDEQAFSIAALCKKSSRFFKRYQDIEWAICDEKIYLLQSRPITTLSKITGQSGFVNLWDNSNIAESYNGVTTPLTFSFIRLAYEHVYREMCRMFSVNEKKIEENNRIFSNMLGLVGGQVYYNMLSWYRLISILPGYKMNREFMESMMGVKEPIPEHIRALIPASKDGKLKDFKNLIFGLWGLVRQFGRNEKNTARFYTLLAETLKSADLDEMSLYELLEYYKKLESKLLKKWNAPVANDFYAMIFYGLLKKLAKEWLKLDDENKFNGLLSNTGDIISAKPAQLVREMAELIKDDPEITDCLINDTVSVIRHRLDGELKKRMEDYLSTFGDRCINELKLESETLNDNPLNLYRAVGSFALKLKNKRENEKVREIYDEKDLLKKLGFFKRKVFKFVLKNARRTIKNRENMRFERTKLFGVVRSVFKRAGIILASFGKLAKAEDIFYLEVYEVLRFIEGTSTTSDLKPLATIRKNEFSKYDGNHPDRFETFDCVHLSILHTKEKESPPENGDTIYGLGCCPGIVKGIARVVTDPCDAKLASGEILVAQRTDPGWIMLFPVAAAVVVEYGSLLSHAAIVVREMSIPAVVSVPNLFEWINDGDLIEIDGEKGTVRRIENVNEK